MLHVHDDSRNRVAAEDNPVRLAAGGLAISRHDDRRS